MTEVKIAAHPWLQKLPCLDWWLKIAACPWLQKLPFLDWRLCIATTLVQLEYCYPPKSTKKVDFSGGDNIYLSNYLSVCLSIYLSIYLPIYLSIHPILSYPILSYLSISLSIYLSIRHRIYLYLDDLSAAWNPQQKPATWPPGWHCLPDLPVTRRSKRGPTWLESSLATHDS